MRIKDSMENSVEFLSQIEIFSLLGQDDIGKISGLFKLHEIGEGEVLFREGDEGNELFIVKSGIMASSIQLAGGGSRELATFQTGNFFGEMSIFEKAPRSATCYCKKKCVLMSLHENDFYLIMEQHPDIATKIMYRMLNITTQRLRDTGEFLSDMVHWGEAARKRAITDELTGAYNRRFLDDALEKQFTISKNNDTPLSLMMIDLDYFRSINEHYGNETGDKMIIAVVGVINRNLRERDVLARFGGDEFTILLPHTDSAAAFKMAEKMRKDVEALDILEAHKGPISRTTLSIGVAAFPEHAKVLHELKESVDKALYQAKEGGRNKVVRFGQ